MLQIRGGTPLCGDVRVAGFKHVVVLAVAYMIGARRSGRIDNVPDILDTRVLARLLCSLGVGASVSANGMDIEMEGARRTALPEDAAAIHGSLYLVPAFVAAFGSLEFGAFGGCAIGAAPGGERPWRHVVRVLERFGATADLSGSVRSVRARSLRSCTVDLLDFTDDRVTREGSEYSGATKAAILCAVFARGRTTLLHPYLKAEVLSFLEMLRADGVSMRLSGEELEIIGRGPWQPRLPRLSWSLPADLLEAATWITATAMTGGCIRLHGALPTDLRSGLAPELELWSRVGVRIVPSASGLTVESPGAAKLRAVGSIHVTPLGIYSDSQPLFAALATCCRGDTSVADGIWRQRYGYTEGFEALGGQITRLPTGIRIHGSSLHASPAGVTLHATDLRCAAAFVLAALTTRGGPVRITGAHHLARGYDGFISKLQRCGADVAWVAEERERALASSSRLAG